MASINESIKNLLTRESIYQAYLDVEVALAKAQAKGNFRCSGCQRSEARGARPGRERNTRET